MGIPTPYEQYISISGASGNLKQNPNVYTIKIYASTHKIGHYALNGKKDIKTLAFKKASIVKQ